MRDNRLKIKDKIAQQKRHWVRLTKTCNNRCIFCLDSENQNGTFVPVKKIKEDLLSGLKENAERAILSGGEPTIHPDFLSIVKMTKKMGYNHIQVVTNGRMFAYKDFLASAIRAGVSEITFSIHGHTSRLHERQTGVKGSFNQSLAGLINALKTPRLIVSQDIVINNLNYRYLAKIMKFFIALGIREFDLLQVIPFGRAWDNRKMVLYDIEKAMPYLREAFNLSRDPNLFIWTNRFPAQYLEGFEALIQHPKKIADEVKGREELFRKFLISGKKLSCYPQRCQFCFLESFCQDLLDFQQQKFLESKENPDCLKGNLAKKSKTTLEWDKKMSIYQFLDFYTANRYFAKSLRCQDCIFCSKCSGANIDYIRKYGFKELKPFK